MTFDELDERSQDLATEIRHLWTRPELRKREVTQLRRLLAKLIDRTGLPPETLLPLLLGREPDAP